MLPVTVTRWVKRLVDALRARAEHRTVRRRVGCRRGLNQSHRRQAR